MPVEPSGPRTGPPPLHAFARVHSQGVGVPAENDQTLGKIDGVP
jgi:hypothetical protein